MQKKTTTTLVFSFLFFLLIIVLFLSHIPFLQGIQGGVSFFTTPLQRVTFGLFHQESTDERAMLKKENQLLAKKFVDQKKLVNENNALKDQFRINNPPNLLLLPATVIGAPGFVPGVSQPEELILSVGSNDGVKVGQAVVVNGNLIGSIGRVFATVSVVTPLDFMRRAFTVTTVDTNATGLLVSEGDGLRLENVLLSDTLNKDALVVTKGDINEQGEGFLPGIVVGKIRSVDKKPSSLFQTAKIVSLVDIATVSTVFVVLTQK